MKIDKRDILRVIEEARSLIETEDHWTQYCSVRDMYGATVPAFPNQAQSLTGVRNWIGAYSFCASGAIWNRADSHRNPDFRAELNQENLYWHNIINEACKELMARIQNLEIAQTLTPVEAVAGFNDTHTYQEVIDLFDRTIQEMKQEAR